MSDQSEGMAYSASPPPSRRATSRVSASWLFMLLSGLIAAILFIVATNQADTGIQAVVARQDIAVGERFDPDNTRTVTVQVDSRTAKNLLKPADLKSLNGQIAVAPIKKDSVLVSGMFTAPSEGSNLLHMSIPVPASHAVDGRLAVGDQIHIMDIDGEGEIGQFVATSVEVISVSGSKSATSAANYVITVALDAENATLVAEAMADGKLEIVRANGAPLLNNGELDPVQHEGSEPASAAERQAE